MPFGTEGRVKAKALPFIIFMRELGKLSVCQRPGAQLACIIIQDDFSEVTGIGYNGPAAGEHHDTCRGPTAVGSCGCIHAEANAITKMRYKGGSAVAIMSMSPCEHCAGLIINARCIKAILYDTPYRDSSGLDRLARSGIPAIWIPDFLREDSGKPPEKPD